MLAGGFGLIGDIFHNVSAQADNGQYGVQRIAGTVLGPSYSTGIVMPISVFLGLHHAAVGDDGSNYRERAAVREVVGRVPGIGRLKTVRDGVTDAVAGEREDSSSGGFGGFGGFNSGWGS